MIILQWWKDFNKTLIMNCLKEHIIGFLFVLSSDQPWCSELLPLPTFILIFKRPWKPQEQLQCWAACHSWSSVMNSDTITCCADPNDLKSVKRVVISSHYSFVRQLERLCLGKCVLLLNGTEKIVFSIKLIGFACIPASPLTLNSHLNHC